ncbi:hypothetical protein MUCCIDRAFT_162135 [Mucor lusitanicus CBS 277.49]|uniref:Uncharacterized protein n=1 Tax=Mucor lusitanicus CBS 277.49 TaxID=747725 RepID=A0A162TLC0_MUCCL|nr:hypothetical protein MUCCIDRAFT_162135 [Mucor lusitanicus CBS 277.49]
MEDTTMLNLMNAVMKIPTSSSLKEVKKTLHKVYPDTNACWDDKVVGVFLQCLRYSSSRCLTSYLKSNVTYSLKSVKSVAFNRTAIQKVPSSSALYVKKLLDIRDLNVLLDGRTNTKSSSTSQERPDDIHKDILRLARFGKDLIEKEHLEASLLVMAAEPNNVSLETLYYGAAK